MADATPLLATLFADAAETFGLSRPAGQCFSAVWRAAQPPCADDLVTILGLSRSNVSTALKELRSWGLVGIMRAPGDRKEYFTAPADPWEVLRLIMAARQRLVIGPLLDRLVAAEARIEDVRIAALHSVLARVERAASDLTGLEAQAFAKRIDALAEDSGGGDKPKKKKKKH